MAPSENWSSFPVSICPAMLVMTGCFFANWFSLHQHSHCTKQTLDSTTPACLFLHTPHSMNTSNCLACKQAYKGLRQIARGRQGHLGNKLRLTGGTECKEGREKHKAAVTVVLITWKERWRSFELLTSTHLWPSPRPGWFPLAMLPYGMDFSLDLFLLWPPPCWLSRS